MQNEHTKKINKNTTRKTKYMRNTDFYHSIVYINAIHYWDQQIVLQ